MLELSYSRAIVILAGVCSGATLGAFLITKTEGEKRNINVVINPLELISIIDTIILILLSISYLLIIAILFFAVGFVILRAGGIYRMDADLSRIFGFAFVFGIAIGKTSRYLYWRSK